MARNVVSSVGRSEDGGRLISNWLPPLAADVGESGVVWI